MTDAFDGSMGRSGSSSGARPGDRPRAERGGRGLRARLKGAAGRTPQAEAREPALTSGPRPERDADDASEARTAPGSADRPSAGSPSRSDQALPAGDGVDDDICADFDPDADAGPDEDAGKEAPAAAPQPRPEDDAKASPAPPKASRSDAQRPRGLGRDQTGGKKGDKTGDGRKGKARKGDGPPGKRGKNGAGAQNVPARTPSRLTRRIVSFNLIGLGLLVAGVLVLNDFRGKLIELRTQALETQGEIIAITLAESATPEDGGLGIDPEKAQLVLDRLVEPARVRAQVFDRGARLMVDTRLQAGAPRAVETEALSASRFDEAEGPMAWIEGAGRFLRELATGGQHEPVATEILGGVARMQEVYAALGGHSARGERVNAKDELIVSVSVPIQTLRKVHGALVLSTQGGDIDAIVRSERISILQVFLVALAVSVVLSVLTAKAIGRPIERLARAALAAERGENAPGRKGRVSLPDMTARGDEIGYLSGALKRMTESLYQRIEATEAFAADVAHEIKNPLSSLRSAVETLGYARTEQDKARLMKVMNHDVARLDRLVTDISNASRLDAELVREAREPFDLADLLGTLVEFTQPKAQERGVRIRAEAVAAPLPMRGIEGRLAQVFVNLIENALSFSPEGSEVRVAAARGGDGLIRVTVEDEGAGIPDDNLDSIFERFYSERPDTEDYGNHSGLGLSISRQIVEAHGGAIFAENIRPAGHERRGARFVVELRG